jgi:hypothetical protein
VVRNNSAECERLKRVVKVIEEVGRRRPLMCRENMVHKQAMLAPTDHSSQAVRQTHETFGLDVRIGSMISEPEKHDWLL